MNPEDRLRDLRDPNRWTGVRVPRAAAATAGSRRARIPAPLAIGFAIALLAVAGISIGFASLHRPAPPAAETPSATPSAVSSPAHRFLIGLSPAAQHVYSASRHAPQCTLAQLQIRSSQDGGGAAGTYVQQIRLHNTGADCELESGAVSVGDAVATLQSPEGGGAAFVLPAGSFGLLRVDTATICQPSTANIDPDRPVLPIVLGTAGSSRTMSARYPSPRCEPAITIAELDATGEPTGFAEPVPGLAATAGDLGAGGYDVTFTDPGSTPWTPSTCPTGTEVLSDGDGTVLTRVIRIDCAVGTPLRPGSVITAHVAVTVPHAATWSVEWFLASSAPQTVTAGPPPGSCALNRLTFSVPARGGGATGNWVKGITVQNTGVACRLLASAFAVGSRTARSGNLPASGALILANGSERLYVAAPTTCDGMGENLNSRGGPTAPITVTIDGTTRTIGTFPALHCEDPYLDQ